MKTKILIIISTLFFISTDSSYSQDFMDEFLEYDIVEFSIIEDTFMNNNHKLYKMRFISNDKDNLIYKHTYKNKSDDSVTISETTTKSELRNLLSNDLVISIDSLDLLSYFNEELKEEYVKAMYSNLFNFCVDNRPSETEYKTLVRNELKRLDTISKEAITFILEYPELPSKSCTNFHLEIINSNYDTLKIFSETNPEMNPFSLPWVVNFKEMNIKTYNIDLYIFFRDFYFGETIHNYTYLDPYNGLYPFMSKMRRVFIKEGIIKIPPTKYDE